MASNTGFSATGSNMRIKGFALSVERVLMRKSRRSIGARVGKGIPESPRESPPKSKRRQGIAKGMTNLTAKRSSTKAGKGGRAKEKGTGGGAICLKEGKGKAGTGTLPKLPDPRAKGD